MRQRVHHQLVGVDVVIRTVQAVDALHAVHAQDDRMAQAVIRGISRK